MAVGSSVGTGVGDGASFGVCVGVAVGDGVGVKVLDGDGRDVCKGVTEGSLVDTVVPKGASGGVVPDGVGSMEAVELGKDISVAVGVGVKIARGAMITAG